MQRGFTIIEVLIVLTIIAVLIAIALPGLQKARKQAHAGAVIADAKAIHTAFKQYQVDWSGYYTSFNLSTFDPLRSSGQYEGNVQRLLLGGQADGFDAPSAGQEFWIEMSLAFDPTVRVLVSDSDQSPLSGGIWLDGVFKFENGALVPL